MEMENVFNRNLFLWAEYILSRSHVNCLLCLDEFWCELIQTLKVNKFERFFVQCHFLDEHNSSLTLHPSAVPSNSVPDTFSLSSRNLTTSQWHKLNRKIFLSFVMTKRKFRFLLLRPETFWQHKTSIISIKVLCAVWSALETISKLFNRKSIEFFFCLADFSRLSFSFSFDKEKSLKLRNFTRESQSAYMEHGMSIRKTYVLS